jgi:hypothetical protein
MGRGSWPSECLVVEEESAIASVLVAKKQWSPATVTKSRQCSGSMEMPVVLPAASSATLGIGLGLGQWGLWR